MPPIVSEFSPEEEQGGETFSEILGFNLIFEFPGLPPLRKSENRDRI
jgi:hypothetical protein